MKPNRYPDLSPVERAARTSLAILLSAGCPGLGQLAQRRWLAGGFYLGAVLTGAVMFSVTLFVPLFANLNAVLAFAEHGCNLPLQPIPLARMLIWFGFILLVFIVNMVDVIVAARRVRRVDPEPPRLE